MNYKKTNNLIGWVIFGIAAFVYLLCCESTVSFWDCGEYISTAYKLEVGHPPGAPFFQLLGRFFSLFAFGDVSKVALMINSMSALASAFTILFLFWSITLFSKKITFRFSSTKILSSQQNIAIWGAGVIGALAYTFSDTFWFSAVEGEVYALSSLFTAITFWAILKWDEQADSKVSLRWIVLISLLIGISIGVHLLNLLTIPALIFVIYFKYYKPSIKGILITLVSSVLLLGFILWGLIPYVLILSGKFDMFFTNMLGMPIGVGTTVYFLLLAALIVIGIILSVKKGKVILNTILLCFGFLLIGYSSFAILVIRSNAGTPINENKPDDALALVSYLNREQYGETPLVYGLYYNAPLVGYADGKAVYAKQYNVIENKKVIASFFDKYEAEIFINSHIQKSLKIKSSYGIVFDGKGSKLVFPNEFYTFFPRMWSSDEKAAPNYEFWGNVQGEPVELYGYTFAKPTFSENIRFLINYQLNYMYFRYFMWNFSGKFNDLQGRADLQNGHWITGFSTIDKHFVDSYENLPDDYGKKGHNKYYLLPLLLGLIGFFFQLNKDPKSWIVVSLLFFFTGIAIAIYLNQYAYQPRERDYAYAASFYAFAIWIGLGALCFIQLLLKLLNRKVTAIAGTLVCLTVPAIMAKENWDDHNRSGRTIALETAINTLESCAPNAILFTNADNDTFPLWYAQEVEGIRRDVRVVNLSLLNADWYIDACKRKNYESEPVPFSLSKDKYISQNREALIVKENDEGYGLKDVIDFISNDKNRIVIDNTSGKELYYLPGNKLELSVNKDAVLANCNIPETLKNKIQDKITFQLEQNVITKNQLMLLDLLAHFNWQRPVYFTDTWRSAYMGLDDYFQLEGFAYRLVPVKKTQNDKEATEELGYVNTNLMFRNMMTKFRWKKNDNKSVYLDETATRAAISAKEAFVRLSTALINENKNDSALLVLNKAVEVLPNDYLTYNYSNFLLAQNYFAIEKPEKALLMLQQLLENSKIKLEYLFNLKKENQAYLRTEIYKTFLLLSDMLELSEKYNITSLKVSINQIYFSQSFNYLDFCNRQLSYYFSNDISEKSFEDIIKLMQSVNSVMHEAQKAQKTDIVLHAQKIMKYSIPNYNQVKEQLDQERVEE